MQVVYLGALPLVFMLNNKINPALGLWPHLKQEIDEDLAHNTGSRPPLLLNSLREFYFPKQILRDTGGILTPF